MCLHVQFEWIYDGEFLYPPSEWSETDGYTIFTFVCLCVCLFALSPVFNSVCPSHNASATWRIYALSERILVWRCNIIFTY